MKIGSFECGTRLYNKYFQVLLLVLRVRICMIARVAVKEVIY